MLYVILTTFEVSLFHFSLPILTLHLSVCNFNLLSQPRLIVQFVRNDAQCLLF